MYTNVDCAVTCQVILQSTNLKTDHNASIHELFIHFKKGRDLIMGEVLERIQVNF